MLEAFWLLLISRSDGMARVDVGLKEGKVKSQGEDRREECGGHALAARHVSSPEAPRKVLEDERPSLPLSIKDTYPCGMELLLFPSFLRTKQVTNYSLWNQWKQM